MSKTAQKKKPIKSRTQLYPCPYHAQCDIYHCLNRAAWFVGRPDGPISTTFKLCEDCAKDLSNLIPKELMDDSTQREKITAEVIESFKQSDEYLQLVNDYETQIHQLQAQVTTQPEPVIETDAVLEALKNESLLTEKQFEAAKKLLDPEPTDKSNDDTPQEKPNVVYRCLDCNYEAKSEDELAEHQKSHEQKTEAPSEPPAKQNSKGKRMSAQERLKHRTTGKA